MEKRMQTRVQKAVANTAESKRVMMSMLSRPRWKEYTLIRYEGKKIVSREKIWIDESRIFSSNRAYMGDVKREKEGTRVA